LADSSVIPVEHDTTIAPELLQAKEITRGGRKR